MTWFGSMCVGYGTSDRPGTRVILAVPWPWSTST